MTLRVELLHKNSEQDYDELILSDERNLIYTSLLYRDFLKRIITNGQAFYLVVYDCQRMVGAFPVFIKYNSRYGNVFNSLPFFGSNGGIILAPGLPEVEGVVRTLMAAFLDLAKSEAAVAATIISNPLLGNEEFYRAHYHNDFLDIRIGQITILPKYLGNNHDLKQALMGSFHQKTRNCVRKAQVSEVAVSHHGSLGALQTLAEMHRQNMEAICGTSKPWSAFQAIRDTFFYDRDYRVYLAERDGLVIAALLVFFFNRTAEYFTPVTLESHRIFQPMSLLIYEAMQEAARRGCRYWNWGGTWETQSGVYHFKKRWGTKDIQYYYFVKIFDQEILTKTKDQLLNEYPFFYIAPFSKLKTS